MGRMPQAQSVTTAGYCRTVEDSHILTLIITNRRRSTLSQVYKMSPARWPSEPVEKTGYPEVDSGWLTD